MVESNQNKRPNNAPVMGETGVDFLDKMIARTSSHYIQAVALESKLSEGAVVIKPGHRTRLNPTGETRTHLSRSSQERRTAQLRSLVGILDGTTGEIDRMLTSRRKMGCNIGEGQEEVDLTPTVLVELSREAIRRGREMLEIKTTQFVLSA